MNMKMNENTNMFMDMNMDLDIDRHTVGATELARSLSNAILDKLHKEFQPDFFCWLKPCLIKNRFLKNILKFILRSSLDKPLEIWLFFSMPYQISGKVFTHNKDTQLLFSVLLITKQVSLRGLGKKFFLLRFEI